mmetsp:Transcript_8150/g.20054  ORF Transcript_8150/g.20054 Transcript_8150/m.20054 type:complete len:232 (+) Transcript_8150:297-992(+)
MVSRPSKIGSPLRTTEPFPGNFRRVPVRRLPRRRPRPFRNVGRHGRGAGTERPVSRGEADPGRPRFEHDGRSVYGGGRGEDHGREQSIARRRGPRPGRGRRRTVPGDGRRHRLARSIRRQAGSHRRHEGDDVPSLHLWRLCHHELSGGERRRRRHHGTDVRARIRPRLSQREHISSPRVHSREGERRGTVRVAEVRSMDEPGAGARARPSVRCGGVSFGHIRTGRFGNEAY